MAPPGIPKVMHSGNASLRRYWLTSGLFRSAPERRSVPESCWLTWRGGEVIGIEDVLIGATALENDFTVVTRNVRHFSRLDGLVVESWWEA